MSTPVIVLNIVGLVYHVNHQGYSRIKCGTLSFFLCLVFVIVCALRFQNYNRVHLLCFSSFFLDSQARFVTTDTKFQNSFVSIYYCLDTISCNMYLRQYQTITSRASFCVSRRLIALKNVFQRGSLLPMSIVLYWSTRPKHCQV